MFLGTRSEMIDFLKKYSPVENNFVDDFFQYVDPSTTDETAFVVDINLGAKWLKMTKGNLLKTLKASYIVEVDYKIIRPPKPGRGFGTMRHIMLTSDCFKTLCMRSNSEQADRVRAYFIAVEKTLFRYRAEIVTAMQGRIMQLENNQRPIDAKFKNAGVVYIIKSDDSRVKLGRSADLSKRLQSHNSAKADNLEILYLYKTEDMKATEECAKAILKTKQYRKYKEIYEADIDTIKSAIEGCGSLVIKIQKQLARKGRHNKLDTKKGGGLQKSYIVFCNDT